MPLIPYWYTAQGACDADRIDHPFFSCPDAWKAHQTQEEREYREARKNPNYTPIEQRGKSHSDHHDGSVSREVDYDEAQWEKDAKDQADLIDTPIDDPVDPFEEQLLIAL